MSNHIGLTSLARPNTSRMFAVLVSLPLAACGTPDRAAAPQASNAASSSAPLVSQAVQRVESHPTGLIPPPDLDARIRQQKTFADRFGAVIRGTVGATAICDASASTVDLASSGYVSEVQDQQRCGACWAFATVGAYESSYKVQNSKGPVAASEQQIIDCSGAGHCAGGWWAFDYLRDRGDGSRTDVPYTASDATCPINNKSVYRAVNWGYVSDSDRIANAQSIKRALCEHGAVATAFDATPAFQDYTGSGVFKENHSGEVNHGIVIVGWDETKSAWRIKNSWGTGWGDKGFAWVGYGTNKIGFGAAWVDAKKDQVDFPPTLTAILPSTQPMPPKGAMAALAK